MKTRLNELLEFPTPSTYKVMGQALPGPVDRVVEVVQRHVPGDYTPTVEPNSKGSCHSVSITINATYVEQVEALCEELDKVDIARMVLQPVSPLSGSWSGGSLLLAVVYLSPTLTRSPRRCRFVSG